MREYKIGQPNTKSCATIKTDINKSKTKKEQTKQIQQKKTIKKYILLLDIHPKKTQIIVKLLKQEHHEVEQCTLTEYKKVDFITSPPELLIIDIHQQNLSALLLVIKELKTYYHNAIHYIPPIIAVVETTHWHKLQRFDLGAFDYINFPIIKEELKFRLHQAIYSLESLQIENKDPEQRKVLGSGLKLVAQTVEYLRTHLNTNININDLALILATNRTTLSGAFNTCMGMTIMRWLCEQRMLFAAEQLKNTSQSIYKIANQVGYPNQNHFTFAFKRKFEVTPNRYRKDHHINKLEF